MTHVRGYYRADGTWVRPHERDTASGGRRGSPGIPSPRRPREPHWRARSRFTPPPSRRTASTNFLESAAEYCVGTVKDGSLHATADQIAKHVSTATWDQLSWKWSRRRCKWLARLAADILDAKKLYHDIPGTVLASAMRPTLTHEPERHFVVELVRKIPFPGDAAFVEAARSIRVVGVSLCAARGYPLEMCACFGDLAASQSRIEVRNYLVSNPGWTEYNV